MTSVSPFVPHLVSTVTSSRQQLYNDTRPQHLSLCVVTARPPQTQTDPDKRCATQCVLPIVSPHQPNNPPRTSGPKMSRLIRAGCFRPHATVSPIHLDSQSRPDPSLPPSTSPELQANYLSITPLGVAVLGSQTA